jgi:hypothetical protein
MQHISTSVEITATARQIWEVLMNFPEAGFEAMNQALKQRVERSTARQTSSA